MLGTWCFISFFMVVALSDSLSRNAELATLGDDFSLPLLAEVVSLDC